MRRLNHLTETTRLHRSSSGGHAIDTGPPSAPPWGPADQFGSLGCATGWSGISADAALPFKAKCRARRLLGPKPRRCPSQVHRQGWAGLFTLAGTANDLTPRRKRRDFRAGTGRAGGPLPPGAGSLDPGAPAPQAGPRDQAGECWQARARFRPQQTAHHRHWVPATQLFKLLRRPGRQPSTGIQASRSSALWLGPDTSKPRNKRQLRRRLRVSSTLVIND